MSTTVRRKHTPASQQGGTKKFLRRRLRVPHLYAVTDVVLTGKSVQGAMGFITGAAALAGLAVSTPAAGAFLTALGAAAGK